MGDVSRRLQIRWPVSLRRRDGYTTGRATLRPLRARRTAQRQAEKMPTMEIY